MTALIIYIQEAKDAFSYSGKREKRNPLYGLAESMWLCWNRDDLFYSSITSEQHCSLWILSKKHHRQTTLFSHNAENLNKL